MVWKSTFQSGGKARWLEGWWWRHAVVEVAWGRSNATMRGLVTWHQKLGHKEFRPEAKLTYPFRSHLPVARFLQRGPCPPHHCHYLGTKCPNRWHLHFSAWVLSQHRPQGTEAMSSVMAHPNNSSILEIEARGWQIWGQPMVLQSKALSKGI